MPKVIIENNTEGDLTPATKTCLGSALARIVTKAMKDPKNRAAFEAWYLERYGEPYVWKKG